MVHKIHVYFVRMSVTCITGMKQEQMNLKIEKGIEEILQTKSRAGYLRLVFFALLII